MQVHRSINDLPKFFNAVITIGTFDGVHRGHIKIIEALKNEAKLVRGQSVLITFHPHPRKILNSKEPLELINTLEEKTELLSTTGIDHLVIVPFTLPFAHQTAQEYMENFLISKFQPHTIIIGFDHHFGKDRKGNYRLLEEKSVQYRFRLVEIPRYLLDEIGVSSTKIRNAIKENDFLTANKLLGYDFFFEGTVIKGDQLGRKLGYPTANLKYEDADKVRLGQGVFAVMVMVDHIWFKGMLSIGNRPTVGRSDERIEVNIFDFDKDIYGQKIRVAVKSYLRPQEKYATLDNLVVQLGEDKKASLEVL